MTLIETGTQEQVLAASPTTGGTRAAEGSVRSDSILVSLWVTSISGTLDVAVQTMTDEGKLVESFHFSTISSPTVTLITRASGPILQRFRIVATYSAACSYEIYVRGINNMGTVGDVSGPATSTDNAIARFDGTDGKSVQNSPDTIDDSGNISLPSLATVDGRDISVDGAALDAHIANVSNPHATTKAQVGLGNVDNTSDATKNSAVATLTNKTLTSPIINTPTGITKTDVGLSNVANSLQLIASNNLSDLLSTSTARTNLGVAIGTNVQAFSTTLSAFAAYNTAGLITQTAANTYTGRTLTTAASDLTVSNGNGVAGNPLLALATTAVTAGTYFRPGTLTVDSRGRITGVSTGQDPTLYTFLFDDFICNSSAGNTGWTATNSGTGTAVTFGGDADVFNRAVGVVTLNTGSTAAGRSTMFFGGTAVGCGYGSFSIQYRILIPTLSNGTDTYGIAIGFGDTNTAAIPQANGIYFRYDSTTSANWILETANGSTRTSTTSSTAVAAGAWLTLRVDVDAAGTTATYSVNGTSIGTVTTNLPTFPNQFSPLFKIAKTVGTTSLTLVVDYSHFQFIYTSAR